MSDPCDYHTIPRETLDTQTLRQLRDLRASLDDRIDAMKKAQSGAALLAKEIIQEVKAEGPITIEVALKATFMLIRDYRLYQIGRQKPEEHPEVQAFVARIRESIHSKMTEERLDAFGLTEDDRQKVEDIVLEQLR